MANSRPEIGRTCNKSSTSWAIRQKSAQSLGGSWIRNVGVWLAGVFPNVLKFASSVCLWFLVVYCLVVLSHSVCPALCARKNCSPPGSPDHGIFQARILEWIAISFSKRSSQPRDWTGVSRIVGRHFTVWATKEVTATSPQNKIRAWLHIPPSSPKLHIYWSSHLISLELETSNTCDNPFRE